MRTLISNPSLWQRVLHACGGLGCILLIALVLAPAMSGCQTQAEDRNFKFNNPLDPNPDTGDGDGSGTGQIVIAAINTDPDIVLIVNTGIENTNIGNWTLENENTPTADVYTFGGGLTLGEGDFIRVHSAIGSDTSVDLFTGSAAPDWGPAAGRNIARLKNDSGTTIFTCEDGDSCWD